MTVILDGKAARAFYTSRLKEEIGKLPKKPILAIIQIGEREESSAYIKSKIKFGEEIGAQAEHIKFSESVSDEELIQKIKRLNNDKNITGIIVQLPIPDPVVDFNIAQSAEYDAKMHYRARTQKIIDAILPNKDVDGLTSKVADIRSHGDRKAIMPATARGVVELLKFYKIPIEGKKVAVLGRSMLAGRPIKEAIEFEGGKVTVCHSQTPRAEEIKITRGSDIVIVAIGRPKFLTTEFFTAGANQTVVDVGINQISSRKAIIGQTSGFDRGLTSLKLQEEISAAKFVGDVDFDNVKSMVYGISPVPGGVGAMTVLALFENLFDCAQKINK